MARDEKQTRIELINPVLHERGWVDALIREERTPGGADIIDGKPRKRKGRTDYLLCLPVIEGKPPLAVTVFEAKAENKLPSLGIQQAKDYMKRFNVPFVFATNGHLYAEYADDTGRIRDALPLADFPTPEELKLRYENIKEIQLESEIARPLFMPYKGGEAARYYFQDAAIRATLEKIIKGNMFVPCAHQCGNESQLIEGRVQRTKHKRALLALATGTGKTIIAVQLLHKLAQAGQLKRALFVCDRDELRTQGMTKLHAVFGDNAQMVATQNPQRNARILVATYQTLNITEEDDEPRFWRENYPEHFFSHIIIDECHRSAWGKWSIILADNPEAVHIGLTATPRIVVGGKQDTEARKTDEEITAHNLEYFGEPVYEYSMGTGQYDGYLSACEVIRRIVDLDKTAITRQDIERRSTIDPFTGKKVRPQDIEELYSAKDYEVKLMLDDRVKAMSEDLFQNLLETGGPHQKTIIFCARDSHANQVMIAMNNIYEKWCRDNQRTPKEWYAFQCTGNPDLRPSASKLIPDLRGSRNSHFIATTVDLLSTGVDIPNLDNVVFFRYIESPISFYQRVGRGTRTGEPRGSKVMFRVYDYTNATRLFGEEFISRAKPSKPEQEQVEGVESPQTQYGEDRPKRKIIRVGEKQFTVQVEGEGCSVLCEEDGKEVLVPIEEYKQRLAEKLVDEAPGVDELRKTWVTPEERIKLLAHLPGGEGAVRLIRELEDEQECDLFDVLAELGYGLPSKSRSERAAAFSYKNKIWLREFPERTGKVLVSIAKQFEKGGIEELETTTLFDETDVVTNGGFEALIGLPIQPKDLIQETKVRLLA
ncbi:restriction endonuclease subunit R [Candidatus Poribacteria bacterium]|nr:restriction endonuclease subunit R [Candidatus Poribacteria bacterium]